MVTTVQTTWKPGMDLPYLATVGEGAMLAISLPASWLKADRSGNPLLLPAAVRALDRLRALFTSPERMTPGFVVGLREAMRLSQEQFSRKLGVSKMTVSRWECGRMQPSPAAVAAIRELQAKSRREGVKIDGDKRSSRRSAAIRRATPPKGLNRSGQPS